MNRKPSTTIIGAGITGPTAALVLAYAGHQVTVKEQRPEKDLHSNGILGLTNRNWEDLKVLGVDWAGEELGRTYREIGKGGAVPTPFHLIAWTSIHDCITRAAMNAGAQFKFNVPPVNPDDVHNSDYVIDAGGVTSAARRGIPRKYLGSWIYRGTSNLHSPDDFVTFKMSGKRGFLDVGDTHNGAAWALGLRRPEPKHFHTTFTNQFPAEIDELPQHFQRIIRATDQIMILPQAAWTVANSLHDSTWTRFTLGEANGVVRPIVTAGANLGIQAGLNIRALMGRSETVAQSLLLRRAHALQLGLTITGPEIGGHLEDPNFDYNQTALYGPMPR